MYTINVQIIALIYLEILTRLTNTDVTFGLSTLKLSQISLVKLETKFNVEQCYK